MRNIIMFLIVFTQYGYTSDTYYYKNNKKVTITPDISISRSSSNIDYYQNNQGVVLGVTDKLIVKLKDNEKLEQILNEFNLTLIKILSKNIYLLKTTNRTLTIDISNRLNETGYVKYAHPDFIKKMINR